MEEVATILIYTLKERKITYCFSIILPVERDIDIAS